MASSLVPTPGVTTPAIPRRLQVAQGLRDFANAVRHIHDLKTFFEILEVALEKSGVCRSADFQTVVPGALGTAEAFPSGRLTLPIMGGSAVAATAPVGLPVDRQHFGAEDIHLLSAMSEIVGAAVDLSHRVTHGRRAVAALKAVLAFAPVGICVIDAKGRVEAVNPLAKGWLALAEGDAISSALPEGVSVEQCLHGAAFHLRLSGRLLFCECRPQPEHQCTALVMTDLAPEQGRLLDALNREVYRANHLRRPLQFVLLERAAPIGALLAAIPAVRAALGPTAIVGPYDAARIALIFPEATRATVVAAMRKLAGIMDAGDVRFGRSELVKFDEKPEEVIASALDTKGRLADVVRPRVLVHDNYLGVADSIRLILGSACDVTASTDATDTQRLLREQHFDAVLAELAATGSGREIVTTARECNQQVRAFYLSSVMLDGVGSGGDVPVLTKPFNVDAVRDRILTALRSS